MVEQSEQMLPANHTKEKILFKKIKEKIKKVKEKIKKQDPYETYKQFAKYVKVRMQMFVGCVLVVFILLSIARSIGITISFINTPFINKILDMKILEIVSYALLVSTAIELAYTLFTPNLDEAVEPVITGLAATILLGISKIKDLQDFNLYNAGGIALLGLVLALLFVIRGKFLQEENANREPEDSSGNKDQKQ